MRFLFTTSSLLLLTALCIVTACSSPPAGNAERKQRIEELYAGYKKDFPGVPEVSAHEAVTLWREGRLLPVDVRSPAEQGVSRLPGSITGEQYLADPRRYADKEAVAVCTIGYRSGEFAAKARKRGMPVRNLAGGLLAWLHAGGIMVDATGHPSKTVHVYGRTWNLAPLDYKAVW